MNNFFRIIAILGVILTVIFGVHQLIQPPINVNIKTIQNSQEDFIIEIQRGNVTSEEYVPSNPVEIKDETVNIRYTVHDLHYYNPYRLSTPLFHFAPPNYFTGESHQLPNTYEGNLRFLRMPVTTFSSDVVSMIPMNYNNSTISKNIQDFILEFNKRENYEVVNNVGDFADITLIINECQEKIVGCIYVNQMKFLKNHERLILINHQTYQNHPEVNLIIKPEIKYLLDSIEILN